MSENVHVVTDLPAKTRFNFNPKVAAAVVLGACALAAVAALKAKSGQSTAEVFNIDGSV